jgi:hypothetical protein
MTRYLHTLLELHLELAVGPHERASAVAHTVVTDAIVTALLLASFQLSQQWRAAKPLQIVAPDIVEQLLTALDLHLLSMQQMQQQQNYHFKV